MQARFLRRAPLFHFRCALTSAPCPTRTLPYPWLERLSRAPGPRTQEQLQTCPGADLRPSSPAARAMNSTKVTCPRGTHNGNVTGDHFSALNAELGKANFIYHS